MTTLQTILAAPPFILLLATTIFPILTQKVWIWEKYVTYFIISTLYALSGLWTFNFSFEQGGVVMTFIPFIYFFFCYLFDKIFQMIKPTNEQRKFPVYVILEDVGIESSYVKKMGIKPISADYKVSFGVCLSPFIVLLILMKMLD